MEERESFLVFDENLPFFTAVKGRVYQDYQYRFWQGGGQGPYRGIGTYFAT